MSEMPEEEITSPIAHGIAHLILRHFDDMRGASGNREASPTLKRTFWAIVLLRYARG